jgi:hypothetical protein
VDQGLPVAPSAAISGRQMIRSATRLFVGPSLFCAMKETN